MILLLHQIIPYILDAIFKKKHKKVITTIDDKIRDEKMSLNINKEVAMILALSSFKIDKYEYLTGEETLPFNQSQMIEVAKFIYFPLVKAFKEQTKNN